MTKRVTRFTSGPRMSLKAAIKHVIHRTISDRFAKLDLPSHSVEDNRYIWDTWDWSQRGDEWTGRAENPEQWLKSVLDNVLYKYMEQGKEILEIGPGAGRWTEYLQPIAKRLILVDIAPKCIALCKERFAGRDSNIEYHVIDGDIDFIPDSSLDRVWSYDVFVHVNPSDTKRYIKSFSRILRPGGIAVIHHGSWGEYNGKAPGFRSRITAAAVAQFVRDAGLTLVEQNRALAHKQGDVITVFQKEN
ncbi:MAG: class I SAM-dependent methyltransferase [Nitrososphaera sp.]